MKRISYFFASVSLVFGAMGMAAAQEVTTTEEVISEEVTNSHRYEVGSFADNWSIGVGGGVNMYFGEHDRQMNFGDRLSPNLDVYVAKWFTPVVGFRLGYTGLNFRGATNIVTGTPNSTGEIYEPYKDDHQPLYWQKFNFFNIHADFMLNLVNLIGGYKERVFNTSLYAGIGLARAYPHKSVAENPVANNRHSGNLGLFRLAHNDAKVVNVVAASPSAEYVDVNVAHTTGVKGIDAEDDTNGIYDLNGRKLNTPSDGVNIRNGKKILKKNR